MTRPWIVVLAITAAVVPVAAQKMKNRVTKVTRTCADAALTECGDAQATPTLRRVELSLLREAR